MILTTSISTTFSASKRYALHTISNKCGFPSSLDAKVKLSSDLKINMMHRHQHRPLHSSSEKENSVVAASLKRSSSGTSLSALTEAEHQQQSRNFTSLNSATPFQLCFLRHGQSTWNRDNRFIGWTDTPLTDDGVLEARAAGKMLNNSGIMFDEVHTSLLRRSIRTANIALMELGQEYIPVHKNWRLNERSYGALVGQNKKEAVKRFGQDQVKSWRRSFDNPPPTMQDNHPYHPIRDPRYRMMPHMIPKAESLKDTLKRSKVYWEEVLAPALRSGKTLLVVGHENNLRSLIMNLEDISEDEIIELNLPRAVPLAYRLHPETLKPMDRMNGMSKYDEATGMLRGEWLTNNEECVREILKRDHKQVYDTRIAANLELEKETRNKWNQKWKQYTAGEKARPEAKAQAEQEQRHLENEVEDSIRVVAS